MESQEGLGAQDQQEMRVSLEILVPQEKKARLAMRGTRAQMALPERGVALEREDLGDPRCAGAKRRPGRSWTPR